MARPANTIVVVAADWIARADFAAGLKSHALHVWQQPRSMSETLSQSVAAALALGPGCGRKVWVLCEDFWSQIISLAAPSVAGLDAPQLARALGFEAEPLSGIGALESVLAFHPAPSREPSLRSFWSVVVEKHIIEEIQASVKKSGGALSGLGHPGGVALQITAGPEPWGRVELWNQATFCVGREGVSSIGGGYNQPRTLTLVDEWIRATGHKSLDYLFSQGSASERKAPESATAFTVIALSSQASLKLWLERWAECLLAAKQNAPLIQPAARPATLQSRIGVGLVAELVMVALCLLHWSSINKEIRSAKEAAANQQEPQRLLAEATKLTEQRQKEWDALSTQNSQQSADQSTAKAELHFLRNRMPALLQKLAEQQPEDLVVQSISAEPDSALKLRGVCMDASLADELARRLSPALRPSGWDVLPGEKTAQGLLENGGPWEFTLNLRPRASTSADAPPPRAEVIEPDERGPAAMPVAEARK